MKNIIGAQIDLTPISYALSIVTQPDHSDAFLILEHVSYEDNEARRLLFTAKLSTDPDDPTLTAVKSGTTTAIGLITDAINCNSCTWTITPQQAQLLQETIEDETKKFKQSSCIFLDDNNSGNDLNAKAYNWANQLTHKLLNLTEPLWITCCAYLPMTISQALIHWLTFTRITQSHYDLITNDIFFENFLKFEKSLFDFTNNFLQEIATQHGLNFSYSDPNIQKNPSVDYSDLSNPTNSLNPSSSYSAQTHFLQTYKNLIESIRVKNTETARGATNSIINEGRKNKIEAQLKELENNYLNREFMSRYVPPLLQSINTYKHLIAISNFYCALAELVEINKNSRKMGFSVADSEQLQTVLLNHQSKIDKKTIDQYKDATINTLMYLNTLVPFFDFTINDFHCLTQNDIKIPTLLSEKINNNDFKFKFQAVSRIVMHFDIIDKNLKEIIKDCANPIQKKELELIHRKLTYQMQRPSRLALILKTIKDELNNLNKLELLSEIEQQALQKFNRLADEIAKLNAIINSCQSAIQFRNQIKVLLTYVHTPNPTQLQIKKSASFAKILQDVQDIFDNLINKYKKNLSLELLNYDITAAAIREVLPPHIEHHPVVGFLKTNILKYYEDLAAKAQKPNIVMEIPTPTSINLDINLNELTISLHTIPCSETNLEATTDSDAVRPPTP